MPPSRPEPEAREAIAVAATAVRRRPAAPAADHRSASTTPCLERRPPRTAQRSHASRRHCRPAGRARRMVTTSVLLGGGDGRRTALDRRESSLIVAINGVATILGTVALRLPRARLRVRRPSETTSAAFVAIVSLTIGYGVCAGCWCRSDDFVSWGVGLRRGRRRRGPRLRQRPASSVLERAVRPLPGDASRWRPGPARRRPRLVLGLGRSGFAFVGAPRSRRTSAHLCGSVGPGRPTVGHRSGRRPG